LALACLSDEALVKLETWRFIYMLFLKKMSTDSETQLAVDFGHYPPKPLQSTKVRNQFDVVYIGSVARIFYAVKLLSHTVCEKSVLEHPDFREAKKSVLEAKDRIRDLRATLNSSPFYISWILLVVSLVCLSPLLVPLCAVLYIYFLVSFIKGRVISSLGHFLPLPNWASQIVIFPNRLRKLNYKEIEMTADGVVSHEHVHLMQNMYFANRFVNKFDGEKGDLLKSLLVNPEQDFNYCSYHLLPDEMEARLHELVLSYYRKYGELPLDFYGFVSLLLGSKNPNGHDGLNMMAAILVKSEEIEPSKLNTQSFEVRCGLAEFEMGFAIMKLADFVKYMREVLPVMYGNLLILYGDTNRAKTYFETLGPCDLYKELYGESVIPNI
jgi:hypothetical protein